MSASAQKDLKSIIRHEQSRNPCVGLTGDVHTNEVVTHLAGFSMPNVSDEPRRGSVSSRADGSIALLGRGRVLDGFVQCFRSNIGTVRPGNGPAIDEELLKVSPVLQRFEDRSVEPRLK